jgi:GNAT superfamily N-acetyltransferase
MAIRIVNYIENPDKYGHAFMNIYGNCMKHIAANVSREPGLGSYVTPNLFQVQSKPKQFLKASRVIRNTDLTGFLDSVAMSSKKGRVIVAIDEDGMEPVAVAKFMPHYEGTVLSDLYVDPPQMGKGIGKRMLKECEEFSVKNHRGTNETVFLGGDCLVYQPTIKFYVAAGFRLIDEIIRRDVGDTSDGWVPTIPMIKKIEINAD